MNSWTETLSPPGKRAADRGDDPAARTPFCDVYCLLWLGVRLHTIACDIANRRDPILPSHMELEDAVRGTPYEEVE